MTTEFDALISEGAQFVRQDINLAARQIAEGVKAGGLPKTREELFSRIRAAVDAVSLSKIADKLSGIVMSAHAMAQAHHNKSVVGKWPSPSAAVNDTFWKKTSGLSDEAWDQTWNKVKRRSEATIRWTLASAVNDMVVVHEEIDKKLRQQQKRTKEVLTKFGEMFAEEVDRVVSGHGLHEDGDRALQIADAQAASEYGATSYRKQAKAGGYIGYVTKNDGRVRPNHLAMHNHAWPAGAKVWEDMYPPNGPRCRCRARWFESRSAAKSAGFTVHSDTDKSMSEPDEGYKQNPATKPHDPLAPKVVKKLAEPVVAVFDIIEFMQTTRY